jgi:hypothetical protein
MTKKTYRNEITGAVGEYEERTASRFDYLVEVDPDEAFCAPCAAQAAEPAPVEDDESVGFEGFEDDLAD